MLLTTQKSIQLIVDIIFFEKFIIIRVKKRAINRKILNKDQKIPKKPIIFEDFVFHIQTCKSS